jgi:hypothetical protein
MKKFLALRQASWHIYEFTYDSSFWNSMFRQEILPWFWELKSPSLVPSLIDAKSMYLWFYKHTTPSFGVEDPFLEISNRRRIWRVCEEIKKLYMGRVSDEARFSDQDDEAVNQSWRNAFRHKCL